MASNKTTKISSSNLRLPIELMLEILSRLPATSLKCIQSYFGDDLSDCLQTSSFIHKHAFHVSNNPTNELLIVAKTVKNKVDLWVFKTLLGEPIPKIIQTYNLDHVFKNDLPFDLRTDLSSCKVIGSSNGLICLYFKFYRHRFTARSITGGPRPTLNHLVLWNPCTREHHALSMFITRGYFPIICGFGYDTANKTYKVINVIKNDTQVYDLSTDKWKTLDPISLIGGDSLGCGSKPQNGKYLNGALHWLVVPKLKIVSIDLSTEVISSHLKLPHLFSSPDYDKCLKLGVANGCLLISYFESNDEKLCVWVMKEYGKHESWINISMTKLDVPSDIISRTLHISHHMWFSEGSRLAFWYCKADRISYVDDNEHGILHVDTLVSPKPEIYGFTRQAQEDSDYSDYSE